MRLIKAIWVWIYRLYNYLQTWQAHRDTILHLNRMTDKDLKDIGITRSDINRMVWFDKHKDERGRGTKK